MDPGPLEELMVHLGSLWLPVVLSAALVFLASFVAWVVLPHHRADFAPLPDEGGILADLRSRELAPRMYSFPYPATGEEARSDAFKERVKAGPAGFLLLQRGEDRLSMGAALFRAFVFYLGVGVFVAYIGYVTLAPGTDYRTVFRVTGTAALLAHCGALFPRSIWFGFSWSMTWKEVADGLVYALLTAGTFGWLWPE
jgi:hypothetical protein